ncbi:Uncharacterized protein APZ42_024733 [Daphnia magna]|uniref:Tyr recombinase domain-containing protein n=1 Tax=Daphnia magna TaxID=35525 RepID=A0A162DEJ5_9CRUS|nr:Uncharacterized protein APZ42_024733 [Daphnia magna]
MATIRPFKSVTGSTVGRWIKSILTEAGVDPTFSAHSTRGAAASRAEKNGIPIDTILKTAHWAQETNYATMLLAVVSLMTGKAQMDWLTNGLVFRILHDSGALLHHDVYSAELLPSYYTTKAPEYYKNSSLSLSTSKEKLQYQKTKISYRLYYLTYASPSYYTESRKYYSAPSYTTIVSYYTTTEVPKIFVATTYFTEAAPSYYLDPSYYTTTYAALSYYTEASQRLLNVTHD